MESRILTLSTCLHALALFSHPYVPCRKFPNESPLGLSFKGALLFKEPVRSLLAELRTAGEREIRCRQAHGAEGKGGRATATVTHLHPKKCSHSLPPNVQVSILASLVHRSSVSSWLPISQDIRKTSSPIPDSICLKPAPYCFGERGVGPEAKPIPQSKYYNCALPLPCNLPSPCGFLRKLTIAPWNSDPLH